MEKWNKIKYLLISFVLAIFIWTAVNYGERLPLDITRFVEVKGKKEGYIYEIEPMFVDITLLVSRRLLRSKFIQEIKVSIDVSNLEEGRHFVKVVPYTPIPILIEPTAVNPPVIEVIVKKSSE